MNPPSTPTLKEEKRAIEDREAERRKRVLRGSSSGPDHEEWWSMDKVESFYRECCEGCDEKPDPAITNAFKHANPAHPRAVDFSGVQMTLTTASILSDVFTVEWGLRKLTFKECDLDEHTLKPILHALLIPNTLSYLSLESNKRLKTPAFRLVGVFLEKAQNMQFLDLSQNPLEKKAIEHIVAAIPTAPTPGLVSLRLDDCQLRHAALETLARAVRTSSLRNISLRYNRINQTGAVAIALMIRDYPDVVPSPGSTPASSTPPSPVISGLPPLSPPTTTLQVPSLSSPPPRSPPPPPRSGPLPPPPKHPAQAPPQTTYTPYIPRSKRGQAATTTTSVNPLSATGQHVPIITSSVQGGVTARHSAPQDNGQPKHAAGPSAALLDKVRALDTLPRLGALRTLDLKGNDLRTGITYIAQVLKRNRTLKVLNLSENKLDVQCLISVAEALKYNSSLETLDLSKNPCCGPGLEGIQSLRTAFTLNTALKRLFLSSTQMTSAGAIALAEFLPESSSLLHLDLTMNNLDIAGVMALSSGLKANHVMRCLDLNIPPGDEEFARMCREILSSCVRNTEEAEKSAQASTSATAESGRGQGKGVWGMIEESELAKTIRLNEEKKIRTDVLIRGKAVVEELRALLDAPPPPPPPSQPPPLLALATPSLLVSSGPSQPPTQLTLSNSIVRARDLVTELEQVVTEEADPSRLEQLLDVNDELRALLQRVPKEAGVVGDTNAPATSPAPSQRPTLNVDLPYSPRLVSPRTSPKPPSIAHLNGHANGSTTSATQGDEDDDAPPTPRVDKGKGRAEPEPDPEDKVLSPTFMLAREDVDDEGDEDGPRFDPRLDARYAGREEVASPTVRSRSWVEEEGEVFRKGTVLLGPEEMEGEYAGEELRRELLEAMVERPPPREVNEDGTRLIEDDEPPAELKRKTSNNSLQKKTSRDSLQRKGSKDSLTQAPRPYISRSRSSSNSIMGVLQQGSPSVLQQGPASALQHGSGSGSNSPVPGSPALADASGSSSPTVAAPSLRRKLSGAGLGAAGGSGSGA
ncbi:hypothetical protein EV715DRAFT_255322 [Schizophyllum commune]